MPLFGLVVAASLVGEFAELHFLYATASTIFCCYDVRTCLSSSGLGRGMSIEWIFSIMKIRGLFAQKGEKKREREEKKERDSKLPECKIPSASSQTQLSEATLLLDANIVECV